uniref:Uncharacterized protein n=1 Tax=Solanum tuberosum TaxID=4113 RepID=M0ZFZ2_SOLTU
MTEFLLNGPGSKSNLPHTKSSSLMRSNLEDLYGHPCLDGITPHTLGNSFWVSFAYSIQQRHWKSYRKQNLCSIQEAQGRPLSLNCQ